MISKLDQIALILQNRAIRTAFIVGLVVGMGLAILLTGSSVKAVSLEDYFITYPTGNLGGNGSWFEVQASYQLQVIEDPICYSGSKCLHAFTPSHAGVSHANIKAGEDQMIWGSQSIKFYTETYNIGGIFLGLKKDFATTTPERYVDMFPILRSQGTSQIWLDGSATSSALVASTYDLFTWNNLEMEFNYFTHQARASLNGGDWSDLVVVKESMNYADNYYIEIAGKEFFYIDSLIFGTGELVDFSCGTGSSCTFCNTSSTCASSSCYWHNNYCWWQQPATTTDFLEYYQGQSDFATPTALLISLQNFTAPFIENINSFLTAFSDFFDLETAHEKGVEFGNAIPTARSYLTTINDFFNGLPISEVFIFYVLVCIVVIVFRVVRILIGLIKP